MDQFTAPPEARRATLQSYRDEIKGKNAGQREKLEEDPFTKTIHMNRNLGDWKEYSTLSYNENALGHMILTEIEHLRRTKHELENLVRMMAYPGTIPPMFPGAFPKVMNLDNAEEIIKPEEEKQQ